MDIYIYIYIYTHTLVCAVYLWIICVYRYVYAYTYQFSSVTQSCLTLQPHRLQHTRLPCLSPSPRACSNSCLLSGWCHLTISSSVVPFSSCLQSFSASVFSSESVLRIRWPKYYNLSFSISPSNEYSGWISFRIDWFDLLAIQGTLKSLLQHHTSKASIFQHSAFFMVQLSHPYVTTGNTIALTRWTFVSKVMSLLFNILSRFVIGFLPSSEHLLVCICTFVYIYIHIHIFIYVISYTQHLHSI